QRAVERDSLRQTFRRGGASVGLKQELPAPAPSPPPSRAAIVARASTAVSTDRLPTRGLARHDPTTSVTAIERAEALSFPAVPPLGVPPAPPLVPPVPRAGAPPLCLDEPCAQRACRFVRH